jgi:hypothetical protein
MLEFLENLIPAGTIQLALLIGSGLLVLGLVTLALTRWGQVSPIWKCVILSCMAHILLMVYAYGTHLIFVPPIDIAKEHDSLKISLIEDADFADRPAQAVETVLPDLEHQLDINYLAQPLESFDRPVIDSEVVIERVNPRLVDIAEIDLSPPVLTDEASELAIESLSEQPTLTRSKRLNIEADLPKPESSEIQLERLSNLDQQPLEPNLQTPPLELQRPEQRGFEPLPYRNINQLADQVGLESKLLEPDGSVPLAKGDQLWNPPPESQDLPFALPVASANARSELKRVSAPRRLADGRPLPELYSLRGLEDRLQIAVQRGGTLETEQAVQAALKWLVESQEEAGNWDASRWGAGRETMVFGHDRKGAGINSDSGLTGLGVLALLAAGHTQFEGPYREHVQRGLNYLIRQQKRDGDLAGNALLFARMYCHSMALLALSEALAMTGDPVLTSPVQKGVQYSLQAQNRQDGGWRYQPGDPGDMSQFGWVVLALSSARLGGVSVPADSFEKMNRFLESCAAGTHGGLSAYRPGHQPSATMTAEALLCRFLLNGNLSTVTQQEASRKIISEKPATHHKNLYYWYYGTLAMYHVGGPDWIEWNEAMKQTLVNSQVRNGALAGSWDPDCLWGGYGGRVYSTTMATLCLQVYYRYLPSLRTAEDPTTTKLR